MSDEEKFAIIGRLTMELSETRQHAAFLTQELEFAIQALETFLASIRPRTRWGPRPPVELPDYAKKYTDLTKLLALIEEQDQTHQRMEELDQKLRAMGAG
jgi:hypothetical protein